MRLLSTKILHKLIPLTKSSTAFNQNHTTQGSNYGGGAFYMPRALGLSTVEGYTGYGAEQGEKELRARLASTFYPNLGVEEDDIFVLFGSNVTMAVQDPSYPEWMEKAPEEHLHLPSLNVSISTYLSIKNVKEKL